MKLRYDGPHDEVEVFGHDGRIYAVRRGEDVDLPEETAQGLLIQGRTVRADAPPDAEGEALLHDADDVDDEGNPLSDSPWSSVADASATPRDRAQIETEAKAKVINAS